MSIGLLHVAIEGGKSKATCRAAELESFLSATQSSADVPAPLFPRFLSLSLCSPLLCCLSSLPLGWLNCPDYLLCHFTFRKSRLELARRPVEGGSTYQPPPLPPLCASPPCCCPAAVLLLNLQLLGLCRTGSVKELS